MLKGKAFMEKITLKPGPSEGIGHDGSTSSHGVHLADRTLRSCAQNCLVIKAMTWQEPDHFVVVKISAECARLFSDFDSDFRRRRSSEDMQAWLRYNIGQGGFMRFLEKFVALTWNEGTLVAIGMDVTCGDDDDGVIVVSKDEMLRQEDLADMLGQAALQSVHAFLRRFLDFFGWPHYFIAVLEGGDTADACSKLFRSDWELAKLLDAIEDKTPKERLQATWLFQ